MKVCRTCGGEIVGKGKSAFKCSSCISVKRKEMDKNASLRRYRTLRDTIALFEEEYYFLDEKSVPLTRKKPLQVILQECGVEEKTIKEFFNKHEILYKCSRNKLQGLEAV